MYKRYKFKYLNICFEYFPISRKNVSSKYQTGMHKWDAFDCRNYSVVFKRFRIIVETINHNSKSLI